MNALTPISTAPFGSPLTIEIVHDFVCPWCYLGVRRLMTALAQRPDDRFELIWRPFLLNPDFPREGVSRQDYVIRKFGGEDRARRLYATIETLGAETGIGFRFDRIRHVPSTVDAHRLAGWAARFGLASAMAEALFAGHFVRGLDIGDPATLADLAHEVGLSLRGAHTVLHDRDGVEHVQTENLRAHRRGIGGVPCFVFGNSLAVSGAQEPEVFQRLLDVATLEPISV